jgi:hypothetical protein
MNTDRPTPQKEKKPCKHYWERNSGGRVFCIHCDATNNKESASQPEPAKDEWRVDPRILLSPMTKVINIVISPDKSFDLVFPNILFTEQEAEAIAKQIVEDHRRIAELQKRVV